MTSISLSFSHLLEGSYEKLFSDSQSDLHALAVEFFQFYASNGVELELH